ncbi:2OG-Fe(II) oxygenase [Fulvivirga sediminis]|uniref:2OG-Fe(II) oxygenase n=1 Tax=Fulvivirga sediminis TaxID=2803949 RepID=A0A937F764_9BACT|nr:2OG-Fe(II) oxygenase [Fulvivirga sediminis]MBL3655519.1 2OG-Fe(II) oxygenase [Fulvivirga sediminis]
MESIHSKVRAVNWQSVASEMHMKGYAILPSFLSMQECDDLKALYPEPAIYRKVVPMERYRFGRGEYKYFKYPLPDLIDSIRRNIYPYLVPIANAWMKVLNIDQEFPHSYELLQKACHEKGQLKPTPLILKYGEGGYNTLHQDLYGDVYFPIQTLVVLSERGQDFTGGEFVMTEQVPRAQSKPIVLKPNKGDLVIFTTNFRPVKGARGYYRVTMKHGVSEVESGERYAMGVIFHDAGS